MPAAVKLRDDYSAEELRAVARRSKDVNQSRRLLSLAAVRDGMDRGEAAKIGGMDRQTLRDWVHRFNAAGPDGLFDNWTDGPPESWSGDQARLEHAGVPAEYRSPRTKSEIALAELDRLIAAGVRFGTVLADAGYGMGADFRRALSARGLAWAVGIPRHQKVYPRGVELVFPVAGRGRPRKRHVPNVLSASAEDRLTQAKWRTLSWRKGTKGPLKARFAAVRVRVADGPPQRIGDKGMQHMPGDEVWLVGERRASGEQKYYLANLPAEAGLKTLAATIKARWVCEQAHQQLKEELGLDHFEGRSWRGLHRHALMTMIAYAFLQHHRLAAASERKRRPGASGGKKSPRRPAAADAAGHTKSRRRRPGARSALPMPALPPANPQTTQLKVPK